MGLLKGIPRILSPELLKALHEMGHGDTIVFGDANNPVHNNGRLGGGRVVDASGHRITDLLSAALRFFPVEESDPDPVVVMAISEADRAKGMQAAPVWQEYLHIINSHAGKELGCTQVSRQQFYDLSKKAYALVNTGETALYGNVILTKGLVTESTLH